MEGKASNNQHQVIARRVIAHTQTAVLLSNGNLTLADSQRGVQIRLDSYAAYDLLDMLYSHRDMLHGLCQQEGAPSWQ